MAKKEEKKIHFSKPTLLPDDLIEKLTSCGLDISDKPVAFHALTFIGYFRLRGYCYPFYQVEDARTQKPLEPKTFITGTTFQDILNLYEFDRKFRLLIIEEIQKIEVGLRTCLSEYMSIKYGPHWFMNLAILNPTFDYTGLYNRIKDTKELFISHYHNKYQSPAYPPSWMITEVLTFGTWSRLFSDLFISDQKAIAKKFSVKSPEVMASWFHCLSHLRNLCAHHNRVWNRNFQAFMPKDIDVIQSHLAQKNTVYSRLSVIKYLSDQVSISNGFTEKLSALLALAPAIVSQQQMGFVPEWQTTELWKVK